MTGHNFRKGVCTKCGCSKVAIEGFGWKCNDEQSTNNATQTPEAESEEIHHARILGLRGKVTFADISRHYRERMLEYHPDKVASLGLKLRELAERESKKINAAMEFFRNKYGPT